jgi:hypothetical protein
MSWLGDLGSNLEDLVIPSRPYTKAAQSMDKASQDAQKLADQQWQRQMQGLSQALGYTNHSQQAFDRIYNSPAAAPGSTLPVGMRPPGVPQSGQMVSPMPVEPNPGLSTSMNAGASGLAAQLGNAPSMSQPGQPAQPIKMPMRPRAV